MLVAMFYNALETEIVALESVAGDKSEYSVKETLLQAVLGIEYTLSLIHISRRI